MKEVEEEAVVKQGMLSSIVETLESQKGKGHGMILSDHDGITVVTYGTCAFIGLVVLFGSITCLPCDSGGKIMRRSAIAPVA